MKFPDWSKGYLVIEGREYTYTVEKDGFYLIRNQGNGARSYVTVNGIVVAAGGMPHDVSGGYTNDANFLPLKKGDIINALYDCGIRNNIWTRVYYIP